MGDRQQLLLMPAAVALQLLQEWMPEARQHIAWLYYNAVAMQ